MRRVLKRLVFCQHRLALAPCAYKAIRIALPRAWKSLFTTSKKSLISNCPFYSSDGLVVTTVSKPSLFSFAENIKLRARSSMIHLKSKGYHSSHVLVTHERHSDGSNRSAIGGLSEVVTSGDPLSYIAKKISSASHLSLGVLCYSNEKCSFGWKARSRGLII